MSTKRRKMQIKAAFCSGKMLFPLFTRYVRRVKNHVIQLPHYSTFVCPTEIIAFSERADEFKAIGVQLLACSTDSVFSHLAWINQPRKHGGLGEMKIPVLADTNHQIARDYGVLKEDEGIAFRGLFIIDGSGNLRQITINDLPVGRSVDETLRLVQAFQFVEKVSCFFLL